MAKAKRPYTLKCEHGSTQHDAGNTVAAIAAHHERYGCECLLEREMVEQEHAEEARASALPDVREVR